MPNKPNGVKLIVFSRISNLGEKQTQRGYVPYYEADRSKNRAIFEKYMDDSEPPKAAAKNKPNAVKVIIFSRISKLGEKQTQRGYMPYYEGDRARNMANSAKYE